MQTAIVLSMFYEFLITIVIHFEYNHVRTRSQKIHH